MPTSSGSLILAIKLTQQQKTTERDRRTPLECSVFTLRKIEDSSLRWKNYSQEEGTGYGTRWPTCWSDEERSPSVQQADMCCISGMGFVWSQQVGMEGPNSSVFAAQTWPLKWGGKQCAFSASHPFRRAFLCPSFRKVLGFCFVSSNSSKKGLKKPFKAVWEFFLMR